MSLADSSGADSSEQPARLTYPEMFSLHDPVAAREALAAVDGAHLHDRRTTAWLVLHRGLLGTAAMLGAYRAEADVGGWWSLTAAALLVGLAELPASWRRRLGSDYAPWRVVRSLPAIAATTLVAFVLGRFVIDDDAFLRIFVALLVAGFVALPVARIVWRERQRVPDLPPLPLGSEALMIGGCLSGAKWAHPRRLGEVTGIRGRLLDTWLEWFRDSGLLTTGELWWVRSGTVQLTGLGRQEVAQWRAELEALAAATPHTPPP
ncbi:MAG: hypothetical protein ACRCYX_03095 [Dermatophilaceae bacterium]